MDLVLSLVMLAALALIGGAIFLWRRQGAVKQVWLMLLLAAVMLANVAVWTMPLEDGGAPLERAAAD